MFKVNVVKIKLTISEKKKCIEFVSIEEKSQEVHVHDRILICGSKYLIIKPCLLVYYPDIEPFINKGTCF